MIEWDDLRIPAAQEIARQGHGKMLLAKDVITAAHLKFLCEGHWQRRGVASYHRPAAWFVEHIQGFGFRLTFEPPWTTRGTLEDYSDNDDLDIDPDVYLND